MIHLSIPLWKKAPFLRLLPLLIAGILLQYYISIPTNIYWATLIISVLLYVIYAILPFRWKLRTQWLTGFSIALLLTSVGAIITYYNNVQHNPLWYGHAYQSGDTLVGRIAEPLTEKNKSYRTQIAVEGILKNNSIQPATGNALLYIDKQLQPNNFKLGTLCVLNVPLQIIKGTGNPAAFDYSEYCAKQGLFYQAFVREHQCVALKAEAKTSWLSAIIFKQQQSIIQLLRKYIPFSAQGIAEALLIGYKEDLDKDLVQAYSNTGVVHIIAISGLHLGVIYALLLLILKPFARFKIMRLIKPVLLIAGLWMFSWLSGACPSVLRSAVMFTCIVLGQTFNKQTSIYNNLAASAFILLAYNPFFLWDAGFQLSYAAVFSIVVGMKNIYHLLYFKHKWVDAIWKFNAVTLSAQLFTLPFVLYHFHQFPNYFLCSNWIAVPLSSIILIAEIILICIAWIAPVAKFTGHVTGWLIDRLNGYIQWLNDLPGAITDHIYFPILYALLLAIIISFGMYAWLHQQKKYAGLALILSILFMGIRIMDYHKSLNQQQLIVYAVPKQSAVDIQTGHHYAFWGDTALLHQPTLFNFNCKPARTFYQCFNMMESLPKQSFYSTQLANTQIIFCAEGLKHWPLKPSNQQQIIVVANNSALPLQEIAQQNMHTSIVWDGSNTLKKVERWKAECAQLQLATHYVTTQGAFVATL